MHDDREIQERRAQEIQKELNNEGLSRRAFLDRLKLIGVGFGAAFVLGVRDADAGVRSDATVSLKSTNPALNDIIEEGRKDLGLEDDRHSRGAAQPAGDGDDARIQTAYARFYRRGYGRGYGRYGRFYGRYGRGYGRYARFYRRFYRRF
ncbi:MAG TPA: hypothetical protein VH934_20475 [Xanthobacteraceae bacterium]|jgi:hypothetical protein